MELTELFWTHLYILGGGLLIGLSGIAYRSKCTEVSVMWGCCSYKRDITSEIQNDEHIPMPSIELPDMENPPPNNTQVRLSETEEINAITARWMERMKSEPH